MPDTVNDVADRALSEKTEADPNWALWRGLITTTTTVTDLSPEGFEQRAGLEGRHFHAMRRTVAGDSRRDQITQAFVLERTQTARDSFNLGDPLHLGAFGSPVYQLGASFSSSRRETLEDWEAFTSRLEAVPAALRGLQETIAKRLATTVAPSRLQIRQCAMQVGSWCSTAEQTGLFAGLVDEYQRRSDADPSLVQRLNRALWGTETACVEFTKHLRWELSPLARKRILRPMGEKIDKRVAKAYGRLARQYLGATVEPEELFSWAQEQLNALSGDIDELCFEMGFTSRAEAFASLDDDPDLQLQGEDAIQAWANGLLEQAINRLQDRFDISGELRALDLHVAAKGMATNASYQAPPLGGSGHGILHLPPTADGSLSKWRRTTTVFHEGVPGHHLQEGGARFQPGVHPYQASQFISGFGEGWGTLGERIAYEADLYPGPAERLGYLMTRSLRLTRVMVDIGLHAKGWSVERAADAMREHTMFDDEAINNDLIRYLVDPGQAICYAVGEKFILDTRDAHRREHPDMSHADADKTLYGELLGAGTMPLESLATFSKSAQRETPGLSC